MKNYIPACKSYDVRGEYPTVIDETLTYILGIGIARYIREKNPQTTNPNILIGSDVRIPNKKLITAFIAGLHKEKITNIQVARNENNKKISKEEKNQYPYGLCSTPMLYYLGHNEIDIAVAFTASHNPPEDVGMKFFNKDCTFLSQKCIRDIVTKISQEKPILPDNLPEYYNIPTYTKLNNKIKELNNWLQKKYITLRNNPRIAVDFSTGAAAGFEKQYLQELLPNTILINDKPDGLFSAHLSETQEHKNYQDLIREIQKHNLEFGCMFDGDADRIGFAGPDGKVIGGDIILALVAEQLIKEKQKEKQNTNDILILYEVMCSQIISEKITEFGAESKMVRMGRFFIKEAMENHQALFAGETSGHFMFKEIGNYEMPLLVIYYVLKALEQYETRENMLAKFCKKYKTPVMSKKVQNKEKVLENIKQAFKTWKQITIDGINAYGEDVWFNIRSSNTENKIRYTVEADTEKKMKEIVTKLEKLIK